MVQSLFRNQLVLIVLISSVSAIQGEAARSENSIESAAAIISKYKQSAIIQDMASRSQS